VMVGRPNRGLTRGRHSPPVGREAGGRDAGGVTGHDVCLAVDARGLGREGGLHGEMEGGQRNKERSVGSIFFALTFPSSTSRAQPRLPLPPPPRVCRCIFRSRTVRPAAHQGAAPPPPPPHTRARSGLEP
jgi:hypothetical protein